MAETVTITKPAPILEGSLTAFLKSIDKLGAGAVPTGFAGIDTSKFAPQVADQVKLQTDAAAAAADLAARQGLGQYQSALGQQQQAVEQAKLDAAQIAAKEEQFQPFTQLGLIGQQLAQIQPGAFPTQTVGIGAAAPTASPMSQFLGGAAGGGSVNKGAKRMYELMNNLEARV